MEVYLIKQDSMIQIDEADVDFEKELEQRLARTDSAEIGGVEILYIGQQGTTEGGKIYDLVGIDQDGNLVVVELKHGKAPRKVIAQALDYASRLKHQDYNGLEQEYKDFRREHGYDESKSLKELHRTHFDLDEPLSEDEFNDEQRMIIIGGSFSDSITNMADYLRDEGKFDVILVQYGRYNDADENVELLTTTAVRRPLAKEPAAQSDKSLTDKQKRRKKFWENFHSKCRERGLNVSSNARGDAGSSAVYALTSGKQNRPAYIQPNLNFRKRGYGLVYNEVRFYGYARDVIADDDVQNKFEKAIDEAVSTLDEVDLPSDLSDTVKWDFDKSRDTFDKVVIPMRINGHDDLQDNQKSEEIEKWLVDTSLVLEEALKQFEAEGFISVQ